MPEVASTHWHAEAEAEPLIGDVQTADRLDYLPRWSKPIRTIRLQALITAMAALLLFLFFNFTLAFINPPGASSTSAKPITPILELSESLLHSWAQYSPYFSAADYPPPPRNCKITQVRASSMFTCARAAQWLK